MNTPIALLTDFGLRDAYVGVVKGVILALNPAATIVDVCHQVPPQDVRRGAFLLATSVPYFPPRTVFVVVVDPGVGTARRAVAVAVGTWMTLVGPDNGVLTWALRFLARESRLVVEPRGDRLALGAGVRAVELTERRFWRPDVSSTFHGRDVFGPVAAELSLGRSLDELGRPIGDLVDLPWPEPRRAPDGSVEGEVVTVDGFGNLITSLRATDLPSSPIVELAGRAVAGLAQHFQASADLVALIGSSGFLELAAPNGSAAALLEAASGAEVRVRPGPERRE